MKLKPFKTAPLLIVLGAIALAGSLRCLQPEVVERVERMTYDFRAGWANHAAPATATNLGFVYIDEESARQVWNGSLGFRFGLLWPRQVYGRLIQELSFQGAKGVAFDVILGELRPDHAPVRLGPEGTNLVESDEFFAAQMRRAGNVLLATTPEAAPPPLFATNALGVADITTDKDPDGVLRRVKAFRVYRQWHPAFRQMEADPEYAVDLRQARIEATQIVLPRKPELGDIKIPLDADGTFDVADFWGEKLPAGLARRAKPFTEERAWHMGVALAALELGVDLTKAEVNLPSGRIRLRAGDGTERTIPVDRRGYFFVDWCMGENHPALSRQSIQDVLAQNLLRLQGATNRFSSPWKGKLVIVGSSAVAGNNLTDRGATPISPDSLLVSKHWNVANSILTGRFVRRSPLTLDLALIAFMGLLAGLAALQPRGLATAGLVLAVGVFYTVAASVWYVLGREWLPIVLPVMSAALATIGLVFWQVVFEQAEQRRVKAIFATVVSPKIVTELLQAGTLSLGGARREITVMFADVRGFTEFTDAGQERAAEHVERNRLAGKAAEECFDSQARETLATINTYLGLVANTVIQNDGTLDKFIGDCVMAFWGAPTPNRHHAQSCVRAAIEAQQAIAGLNHQRAQLNLRVETENRTRAEAGLPPKPALPLLYLGIGINSGMATAGLMGSAAGATVRQGNYTVFGLEVNLASRLESHSAGGRILISKATYERLQTDDPGLAATCVPQNPAILKGIRTPIQVYEVPWGAQRPETELPLKANEPSGTV